jgi:lysylphosphatidylglycerol synthetase-like protein (DUF2156 family)
MGKIRDRIDGLLDTRLPNIPLADLSRDERIALVRRHGDFSTAWTSAVQTDLRYFGGADGYLAFATKMGEIAVLGDPVIAADRRRVFLQSFLAVAPRASFAEISEAVAGELADLGHGVSRIGVDPVLHLNARTFDGGDMKSIRYADRWLEKNGYRVEEISDPAAALSLAERFNESWRRSRVVRKREMGFINRQLGFGEAGDLIRRFFVFDANGAPICWILFDPMLSGGTVTGYVTALKRRIPDAPPYAELGLTKRCAEIFRDEGAQKLSLGLAPLAALGPSGFWELSLYRAMLRLLGDSGLANRKLFNFQAQAVFKRRFHGVEDGRYFAYSRGFPLMPTIALARLTRMI